MVALVDSEETEQMSRHLICSGAALPLPEQRVEVVSLAQDGAFADIEGLGEGL